MEKMMKSTNITTPKQPRRNGHEDQALKGQHLNLFDWSNIKGISNIGTDVMTASEVGNHIHGVVSSAR